MLFFPCTRLEIKFILSYQALDTAVICMVSTSSVLRKIPVTCRINTGLGFGPHIVCWCASTSLRWRHNGHDGVSNHQPHVCLLNSLFGHRSKKTSKFHVTGLCAGNSPGTGEFPAQMASNAEMFPFDDVIIMRVLSHHQVQFRLKN